MNKLVIHGPVYSEDSLFIEYDMKTNRKKPPSRGGKRKPRRPALCFKRVRIDQLRLDGGTQTRVQLDQDAVEEYATIMSGNNTCTLPPIIVYEDAAHMLWLADGFHRVGAAQKNGQAEIKAEVRLGTRLEALLYSLGANQKHGVRRTNADKRCSVEVALTEKTLRERSSREIAKLCGVGHQLVDTIRREHGENEGIQVDESSTSTATAKRIGGDGKMHPAERPKSTKKPALDLPGSPTSGEQTQPDDADETQSEVNEVEEKDVATTDIKSFSSGKTEHHEGKRAATSNKIAAPLKTVVAEISDDGHVTTKTGFEASALQTLDASPPPQAYSDADLQTGADAEQSVNVDPYWNTSSPGWKDVQRWLSRAHEKLPMDRYTEAERRAFDECFTETARCTVGLGEDICPNHQVRAYIAIHAAAALGIVLGESLPVCEQS